MLAVDLVGFCGLIVLWPALGRWSFPLASLVSTAGVASVALYYTNRAYRLIGFEPLAHVNWRWNRRLAKNALSEVIAAGSASAVMSLEAVLAIVIFLAGGGRGDSTSLLLLIFVISPAIRAGYEWAQLFYFDLKKLEVVPFGNLSSWLAARMLGLAWVIGPLFWALGSLATSMVLRRPMESLCWPMLSFFLSRSLLAAIQVQAFAEGAYARIIVNGMLALGGYLALGLLVRSEAGALWGLALINYLAVLLLCRRNPVGQVQARWKEPLPPAVWLQTVSRIKRPIQISAVRFFPSEGENAWRLHREQSQAKARNLARTIAAKLGRHGSVTLLHPGRILWYEFPGDGRTAMLPWFIARGAGLLEVLGTTKVHPSGAPALHEAREMGFLGHEARRYQPGSLNRIADGARSAFLEVFSNGIDWAPGEPATAFAGLSARDARNLIADACVFARDFYPNGRRSGLEVTALCEGNNLRLVFAVDRRSDPEARVRWRSMIRRINFELAAPIGPTLDS
jgi:hypothetical protein